MPPEWDTHDATWMAFPPAVYEGAISLADARSAWARVAGAISQFEPVRMLTTPDARDAARLALGTRVTLVEVALDDAWARDIGPSFVRDARGELVAVDWRFNGWGAQSWASWSHDDRVASCVASSIGVERFRSPLVNEGGGFEVNGEGVVVLTDTVQGDPGRNGSLSRTEIEADVHAALGTTKAVWLSRGLRGDYQEFGTRGHVDLVVKFLAPDLAVVHDQRDPAHPDYAISQEAQRTLRDVGIEVVGLRAPDTTVVDGRLCDWSYVNCYFVNGGLILGVYDDDADDDAVSTFRTLLPTREIVTVDARPLFALGGGVHCVTQQQPVGAKESPCEK